MSAILLLGTLTGILLAVGYVLGGTFGVAIGLGMAIAINVLSYWYSDKLVLRLYKAEPLENAKLKKIVKKICQEAQLPEPRLYLVRHPIKNAFATGRSKKHAVVAVTEGLLELEDEEIEGVLAHEISHIKNRDMLVTTMAATIGGAISFIAQMGYFSMFGNREQKNILPVILIVVFAPLAALFVRLAISRGREYKADWTGALLTKKPEALASALRKISDSSRQSPIKGNAATANLWIANPFSHDWFTGLFSTHPPIEKRVERLEVLRAKDLKSA